MCATDCFSSLITCGSTAWILIPTVFGSVWSECQGRGSELRFAKRRVNPGAQSHPDIPMHNTARLRISGFRGVREADIRLAPQSVLVGPNGCGKSTLIDAISLTELGRTKMVRSLTEHDFRGSDPMAADRVKIIVTIAGFASDDPEDHDTWFRADRAVPKWLGKERADR